MKPTRASAYALDPRATGVMPHGGLWCPAYHWIVGTVAQAFGVTDAAVLKWLRSGVLPPLRVYQAKELLSRFKRPKGKR